MATRVDVIDRFPRAPKPSSPQFIGYGYRFSSNYSTAELGTIAKALVDPKTHIGGYKGDQWKAPEVTLDGAYIAEIRFRPGVTDNVATSVSALLEYAKDRMKEGWADRSIASGRLYALSNAEDGEKLYNPLIETLEILPVEQWMKSGFDADIHPVALIEQPLSITVDLEISDEELRELSKRGIAEETPDGMRYRGPLGLGLDDLHCLRDKYRELGRQISDIELETFAQSWSEHCKHRFFAASIDEIDKGLFRSYIKSVTDQILAKKPGFCLSVFHDNAGGIAFGDHVLAFKVETHNSPSALDPYGGAMTGVLGVNRDCLGFGMGAAPIANVFGYCLPEQSDDRKLFRQADGTNPLPTSKELADGIIKGIEEGGNHSGIPTVQGFIFEDASYRGKPLVYCGTLGIIPREVTGPNGKQQGVEKEAQAGDYIYVFGNHVGYDGIHGATFSSVELDANSPATAVQIGDPITQKNLQDALFKARDRGLYHAITDNGAGGLSSSIGEMAEDAGGAEVWLERVALKYPGLAPWEIWISESQERMIVSVPPENAEAFEELMAHYHVSTQRIGRFADDGMLRLCYNGHELGTIEMDFLHNGEPKRHYKSSGKPAAKTGSTKASDLKIRDVLALSNFQSRASVFRRYDHEVQGKSLMKPLIGGIENMASALRPIWSSRRGVALSQAMMPYLTETDPFMAGYAAVDLAVRRLIAAGANAGEIAILDNYCWSKPESEERLWQLRESARGLYEAALDYAAPIISGKDSMYNDFRGYDDRGQPVEINALPTLLISAMGLIDDCAKVQSFEFKAEGDLIAIYMPKAQKLARTAIDQAMGYAGGAPINKTNHAAPYQKISDHILAGDIASVEALAMGGAGFALIRAVMASGIGAKVALDHIEAFAEYDSGFLVSFAPEMKAKLGDDFVVIGETGGNALAINGDEIALDELRQGYFQNYYGDHS